LNEVDNEYIEDAFDLLIVANLTDEEEGDGQARKVYADQVGLI
jgi:hypothetical protein